MKGNEMVTWMLETEEHDVLLTVDKVHRCMKSPPCEVKGKTEIRNKIRIASHVILSNYDTSHPYQTRRQRGKQ